MKMNKWKSLFAPACVGVLLLSFTSCNSGGREGSEGYDTASWNKWDGDADDRLNSEEFRTAYEGSGYFDQWDANKDKTIDQEEWRATMNSQMGPGYEEGNYGSFEDWDADADGVLNDRELGDGVFAYYDTDNDSYLVEEEYGVWSTGLDYQKTDRPD